MITKVDQNSQNDHNDHNGLDGRAVAMITKVCSRMKVSSIPQMIPSKTAMTMVIRIIITIMITTMMISRRSS